MADFTDLKSPFFRAHSRGVAALAADAARAAGLSAADAYHAMCEDRPHRPAHAPGDAASLLVEEVDAGRLGWAEVDAVLAAAGQATRPPNVAPRRV